jgi:hypothetical protein
VTTRLASALSATSLAAITVESVATSFATPIPPLLLLLTMMPSSTRVHLFPEPVVIAVKSSRAGTLATTAVPRALHLPTLPTLLQLLSLPALEMPLTCLVALNLLPVYLETGTGALSKRTRDCQLSQLVSEGG